MAQPVSTAFNLRGGAFTEREYAHHLIDGYCASFEGVSLNDMSKEDLLVIAMYYYRVAENYELILNGIEGFRRLQPCAPRSVFSGTSRCYTRRWHSGDEPMPIRKP